MYRLNCLNYKYNNQYYFQIGFNKSIKISDCHLIEALKSEKYFSEKFLLDMFHEYNYSEENIKFLKENNIIITRNDYKKVLLSILEELIYLIEYGKESDDINSIFVYSSDYGYRSINVVKAAIELERDFVIERNYKNDMKVKFNNGYIYDINTKYNIFDENIIGINIAKSKSLTSYILNSHGIKVPNKKLFYIDDLSGLHSFINEIKYPICLKPDNLCEAKDVFPCVKNEKELHRIINYYKTLYKEFIVEESIMGNTYRLYYCYGEVIGATHKPKKFVIGDEINTIERLVNQKYRYNEVDGYDEEFFLILERLGIDGNEILPSGEKLYISDRGTADDFEDFDIKRLSPYYNKLALDISKAMGLNAFAIDLIAESLSEVNKHLPTVTEVQEGPEFGRGNLNVNKYYMKLIERLSS